MSSEKDDNLPPSYTDSLRPQLTANSSASHGQSLLDTLTLTRASTIRSTIHTHVLPTITSRAALGIPQSVLVLLPSGAPFPHPRITASTNVPPRHSAPATPGKERFQLRQLQSRGP